jgi:hypothetical protein
MGCCVTSISFGIYISKPLILIYHTAQLRGCVPDVYVSLLPHWSVVLCLWLFWLCDLAKTGAGSGQGSVCIGICWCLAFVSNSTPDTDTACHVAGPPVRMQQAFALPCDLDAFLGCL